MPHRLAQLPDTAGVIAGGLAAAVFADAFAEVNILLLILYGIAVVGDLMAGAWRVVNTEGWAALQWREFALGLSKKLAALFFWLAAALIDVLAALLPAVGTAVGSITPVTKMVLVALIVWEIISITRNAKLASGRDLPARLIMQALERGDLVPSDYQESDDPEPPSS